MVAVVISPLPSVAQELIGSKGMRVLTPQSEGSLLD